jgi:formylglycine-generating enzyme required for sulfatase activity
MSLSFFKSCVLVLLSAVTFAVLSSTVSAQESVSQTCANLGFKLGSRGHTDCVNQNSGAGGNKAAPKPASPAPAPAAKAPVVPVITAEQREDKFWDAAMAAGNKEGFEAYLERYPSGRYVSMAKVNIARLSPVSAPSVAARATSRQPGTTFKDCPDCPEMVVIPAGSFEMGGTAPDELPVHRVTLRSFSMGKTEVTQGQWRALMGSNPSSFSNCGDNCPVEKVSWEDAEQFVSTLSAKTGKTYRLPSEAEWEYACRAGGRHEYCGSDSADSVGWYSGKATNPVAGKQANAWGLHDMSGNVWEWTEDCWNRNYNNAPTDGIAWTSGDCSLRVVRGGSWFLNPQFLRSAFRGRNSTAGRGNGSGFRVARTD